MGGNLNYFKTFSGGLKSVQLPFNVAIICILAFPTRQSFEAQPLLQLAITNVILCPLIMIIRALTADESVSRGLGKLEFGLYLVSSYLYVNFASLLISVGWLENNIAMILGFICAVVFAADAFDKFTFFFCNNRSNTRQSAPPYEQFYNIQLPSTSTFNPQQQGFPVKK